MLQLVYWTLIVCVGGASKDRRSKYFANRLSGGGCGAGLYSTAPGPAALFTSELKSSASSSYDFVRLFKASLQRLCGLLQRTFFVHQVTSRHGAVARFKKLLYSRHRDRR